MANPEVRHIIIVDCFGIKLIENKDIVRKRLWTHVYNVHVCVCVCVCVRAARACARAWGEGGGDLCVRPSFCLSRRVSACVKYVYLISVSLISLSQQHHFNETEWGWVFIIFVVYQVRSLCLLNSYYLRYNTNFQFDQIHTLFIIRILCLYCHFLSCLGCLGLWRHDPGRHVTVRRDFIEKNKQKQNSQPWRLYQGVTGLQETLLDLSLPRCHLKTINKSVKF